MKLTRRAALDGAQLDEIDSRILIQSIEPASGKDQLNTVSLWGGVGSRVTNEHRDSLDVVVKYSLDMKHALYAERNEVLEQVAAWAMKGGWLTISQKPDRHLKVFCAQLPADGDQMEWTNRYSITFRACGVPYWQEERASQLRLNGVRNVSRQFGVGGTRETVMEAAFTNTSGSTVNQIDLTAGSSAFHLRGLGLANGETLKIDHDDDGKKCVLRIRIQGTGGAWRSALDKRTAESSDDLAVSPGIITVGMSAEANGTLLLACAGRYA